MEVSCRVAQKRWRLRNAKDWRLPLFTFILSLFLPNIHSHASTHNPIERALEDTLGIDKAYAQCLSLTAKAYDIPPVIILAILKVEGGGDGVASKNNNGTYDFGVAQINTVRLPELQHFISDKSVALNDTCASIIAISYMLSEHIKEYPDQFWTAVGAYHYRPEGEFPRHHYNYIYKVFIAYQNICKKHHLICSQLNH